MIIRDDEKRIFKVASIVTGIAILFIIFSSIFPRSGYAAVPLAGSDGSHNHVTFGDVYFDGYSRVEFHSDGYYNGYTFTGLTSGANVYEIQPGKLRHVSEMIADLGSIKALIASGTSTNNSVVYRRDHFKSQIWGEGLLKAPLGATLYSTHYVTYGSTTKSMNTDAYLAFQPSWPLPFSADSEITVMGEDQVVIQGEKWIPAVATNGSLGIIDKSQYEEILKDSVTQSSSDALSDQAEYNATFSEAIKSEALNKYSEVIQEEDIANILRDDVIREGEDRENESDITESIGSVLNNNLQYEEIDDLVKEARYLAGIKVPVYDFDGESVIGEFVIDIR